MDTRYYQNRYALHYQVLDTVFSLRLGFYLTGGTALSRFYLDHRYSDDLDFFTHEVNAFGDGVRMIVAALADRFSAVDAEADSREFKRIRVHRGIFL